MSEYFTYLHCLSDGTPFYVGKGKNYRHKEFNHNRSKYYLNIVQKYGKENILVYVFYCDDEQQALNDEIQQISQLRNDGYKLCNLTAGGDGLSGYKHTPETIEKLKTLNKRVVSEETKRKISLAQTGKRRKPFVEKQKKEKFRHSEEMKRNMSIRMMGNKYAVGNTNSLGNKMSEEAKQKISLAFKGKPWTEARRLAQKRRTA